MAHAQLRRGLVVAVLAVTPLAVLGTAAHADGAQAGTLTPMDAMHAGSPGMDAMPGMHMPAAAAGPGEDARHIGLVGMGALAFFAAGSAATAMRHLTRAA